MEPDVISAITDIEVPRANVSVWDRLQIVTRRFPQQLSDRVIRIAVEDVLERLRTDAQGPPELHAHAEPLCAKYLPRDAALASRQ